MGWKAEKQPLEENYGFSLLLTHITISHLSIRLAQPKETACRAVCFPSQFVCIVVLPQLCRVAVNFTCGLGREAPSLECGRTNVCLLRLAKRQRTQADIMSMEMSGSPVFRCEGQDFQQALQCGKPEIFLFKEWVEPEGVFFFLSSVGG